MDHPDTPQVGQADPVESVDPAASCHACESARLEAFPAFTQLPRVTSDCRSWPAGGRIALCRHCGLAQKIVDDPWRAEAQRIYASYQLYHQTPGQTEQVIFDAARGTSAPRSELVLRALLARLQLPGSGRMLDLGCGSGPTLRAFSRLFPGWSLCGYDPHLPDRARVEAIAGVEQVFAGQLAEVANGRRRFDLVTAVHVLEHVPNPLQFLRDVGPLLHPNSSVVVQVPNFAAGPFDLVIADHCTHFTLPALDRLFRQAGLVPTLLSTELLPKEITVIARPGQGASAQVTTSELGQTRAAIATSLGWLAELLDQARATGAAPGSGPLGLFGTSIGGNWLHGPLGPRVDFFVDEDPGRSGTSYHQRPVLRPDEVPDGCRVLCPLPPAVAIEVGARLARRGYRFLLPPGCPPLP